MVMGLINFIKSFFVPVKVKKVKPANTVGSALNFIAEYYGYTDSMYGIVGQGETEGEYSLWDWLKECDRIEAENGGWLTPQDVIFAGAITHSIYLRNEKSMLPYDSKNIRAINIYTTRALAAVEKVLKESKDKQ
jgi:hypothetical protein